MPPASENLTLTTPVRGLAGVTPARAAALAELGVRSVGHLLAYLPMRYERLEAESTIDQLVPGAIVTTRGEVTATRVVARGARPRFEVVVADHTGRLDLVFFNMTYLRHKIQPGIEVRVQGKGKRRGGGLMGLQLANPKVWVLSGEGAEPAPQDERVRPVYAASSAISSAQIEQVIQKVLPRALGLIEDHLSEEYRALRELPSLRSAYEMIHAPASDAHARAARRRLAYDELLLLQLGLSMRRAERARRFAAPALAYTPAIDQHIRARFPFRLTPEQDSVVADVVADLRSEEPSSRLVQGDVGSGKTAVALYAMLMAVASGKQAALLAPTEVLAEQHHASISKYLQGAKVGIELLTGATEPSERARLLGGLQRGAVPLVVGTHALLSERVAFKDLAVAVIDEQHRFGVHQRSVLRSRGRTPGPGEKPSVPHTLVLTATPIPRTLAMTVMGDLDVSTIRALPPGRKPIATRHVPVERLPEVWAFVKARVAKGEQAYVVAPMIDASGKADLFEDAASGAEPVAPGPAGPSPAGATAAPRLSNVLDVEAHLRSGPLQGLRLGVMHGRLDPGARAAVMESFRRGQIDVLIATTVIEVGVDVPNATVMIILDADRFGLAQLHQLRGRVGRGSASSACLVIASPVTPAGEERVRVFTSLSDGFALAERDLAMRGFGSMIGAEQSGMPPFRVADVARDADLLDLARRDAAAWIAQSPLLDREGEGLLRKRLMKSHGPWLGLADVG